MSGITKAELQKQNKMLRAKIEKQTRYIDEAKEEILKFRKEGTEMSDIVSSLLAEIEMANKRADRRQDKIVYLLNFMPEGAEFSPEFRAFLPSPREWAELSCEIDLANKRANFLLKDLRERDKK